MVEQNAPSNTPTRLDQYADAIRAEMARSADSYAGAAARAAVAMADQEQAHLRRSIERLARKWEECDSSDFRSGPLRRLLGERR
jgi:hypothetical protein